MNYKFKTVKDGKLPIRKTSYSAGFDCEAREEIKILGHDSKLVPLGFRISGFGYTNKNGFYDMTPHVSSGEALPYLSLVPRSSIRLLNLSFGGEGVIDIDYRGEVGAVVQNLNDYAVIIEKGQGIAQLISKCAYNSSMGELETIENSRKGGFGSTDE